MELNKLERQDTKNFLMVKHPGFMDQVLRFALMSACLQPHKVHIKCLLMKWTRFKAQYVHV